MRKTLCLLAATALTAGPALANDAPHWGYDGPDGSSHWGEISKDYAACAMGQQQSPINIVTKDTVATSQAGVTTDWTAFAPEVVNNGHSIQINTGGKGGTATLDGKAYHLLQFHFHHASEHTYDGHHYPMEAHFVHKADDGSLLVIGAMVEEGGDANPVFDTLWADIPAEGVTKTLSGTVDPAKLLPAGGTYQYEGSLTTPPCSQIVTWVLKKEPLKVSAEQIDTFAKLYKHDYRPVQPLNRRYVLDKN